jgi:uncharacterized membrane protein YoaK (UPF0700 family)
VTGRPLPVSQRDLFDALLVLLAFGAGSVDGISFLGLGRVFTANMTGNLVLLGVAVGRGASSEVVRSGVAFTAFVAGVLAATLIAGRFAERRPWPTGVKLALAIEAVAQVAFLAGWLTSAGRPGITLEAVLTGVSGLAMGLQSGAVIALGVVGISTTYVTGTLTGLIGGLATAKGSRREWARRAALVTALLVGAGCSGLLVVHARRTAPALPLAVTLLVLGAGLYLLPRAGDSPALDSTSGGRP